MPFAGGTGTEQDPYIITDPTMLQAMQDNLFAHYALGNDIDAADTANWNGGEGFRPIGDGGSKFWGSLDGRGHVIRHLYIQLPDDDDVGLFGYISDATIKDLGLVGVNVTGKDRVGGLVGGADNPDINGCFVTGNVEGSERVGGVLGYFFDGETRNTYAIVSVSGNDYVGGLIGYSDAYNLFHTFRCYSAGPVSGQGPRTGGFSGYDTNPGDSISTYWDIDASGQTSSGGGEGKTTAEMMQQATFVGWDFDDVWRIDEGEDYPRLQWEPIPRIIRANVRFGTPSLTVFGIVAHYQDPLAPHIVASGIKRGLASIRLSADGDVLASGTKRGVGSAFVSGGGQARISSLKCALGHVRISGGGNTFASGTKATFPLVRVSGGGTVTADTFGRHYGFARTTGGGRVRLKTTGPLWNVKRPIDTVWTVIEPVGTRR